MVDWTLEIRDGSGVRRVPLGDAPLTIGRHRDNRLVLGDEKASRFHCVIRKSPEGFRVKDLGSSNGTALNGRLLTAESKLSPGDRLIIGKTRMKVLGSNGKATPEEEEDFLPPPPSLDDIDEPEPLTEDDVAEPIGEEDVVEEGEPLADAPADASPIPMADDESPIELIHAAINDSDHVVEGWLIRCPKSLLGRPTSHCWARGRRRCIPPAVARRPPGGASRSIGSACSCSSAPAAAPPTCTSSPRASAT